MEVWREGAGFSRSTTCRSKVGPGIDYRIQNGYGSDAQPERRKAHISFLPQVRSHFQEAASAGPPPQKDQWYTRTPGAVSFVYPVAHNNWKIPICDVSLKKIESVKIIKCKHLKEPLEIWKCVPKQKLDDNLSPQTAIVIIYITILVFYSSVSILIMKKISNIMLCILKYELYKKNLGQKTLK